MGAYRGYDGPTSYPRLFKRGEWDFRLPSLERVLGVTVGEQAVAYTFSYLQEQNIINDSQYGADIVIFYSSDTLSPFPGEDSNERREVGSTAVYEPIVDDQKLTFEILDGLIVDNNTGSIWNMLGRAVSGPLEGIQLTPVLHGNHFWFAWAQFNPDTIIIGAEAVESAFPLPNSDSNDDN